MIHLKNSELLHHENVYYIFHSLPWLEECNISFHMQCRVPDAPDTAMCCAPELLSCNHSGAQCGAAGLNVFIPNQAEPTVQHVVKTRNEYKG